MLIRILARHFTAGIDVGRRAAPIVDYMSGWTIGRIRDYCRSKRWTVEVVPCSVHDMNEPKESTETPVGEISSAGEAVSTPSPPAEQPKPSPPAPSKDEE